MHADLDALPQHHSVARFFVQNRHVSWVLLIGVIAWGIWAYAAMPKRKDPDIPVRQVAVVTPWPGQSAERVEQLVTRKIEERVAQNIRVSEITSTTRSGLSVVYAEVDENARLDTGKEFDDIKVKLDALTDLPEGAGPIQYIKEFGETSALMLTVASPPASGPQLQLLASQMAAAASPDPSSADVGAASRRSDSLDIALCSSGSPDPWFVREAAMLLGAALVRQGVGTDSRLIEGESFVVIRLLPRGGADASARAVRRVWEELPQRADIHPDVWDPIVITPGVPLVDVLTRDAGPKYSYRELDDFTDRIEKAIRIAPEASRVTRVGVIEEQIEARYSQNRLAALGIVPAAIRAVLQSRNTTLPAGTVNAEGRELALEQSGEFRTLADIDTVVFTQTANGTPLYLRDIGSVHRGYEHPPRLVSYYTWRDSSGRWLRGRAITLSTEMKKGEQIDRFGTAVQSRVADVRRSLPPDLIIGTTSDQQRQVREKLELFNRSLWEAVLLVVLVSFVGFWEWRSAVLMALSIPITLAMTFGLMQLVGLDIQQMSIASLIIALGLLVDDPVVAGDAIKRELGHGHPRSTASWLGPDKLSKAILYATITNIAAYLPFLLLSGDVGRFIYSLPVTIACSLVASRLVSMTFLPLLAYYILKPGRDPMAEAPRESRFGRAYGRAVTFAIDHRWKVLGASTLALAAGGFFVSQLHRQFFPRDNFYIAYVDIRLPEDAPLAQTAHVARDADQIVREVTAAHDRARGGESSLASITSFVGAGGPRFWFSVRPEPPAPNYAQLLLQFTRSEDTNLLVPPLQQALTAQIAGARIDVRTVETGPPTIIPVSMRIFGDDTRVLRQEAEKLQTILKMSPFALNVRDNWGNNAIRTRLDIDQDRAGLAGVSSHDIAISMYSGVSGAPIGYLREGRKNIPIVQLMDYGQRETVTDLGQLYVYSSQSPVRLTLGQISQLTYRAETAVIHRVNQYRAINVAALPAPGHLAEEVTGPLMPRIREFERQLPAGYRFEIVGELKEQLKGQQRSLTVVIASVIAIYLALVFQFRNAVKPFIVFAGIPFGAVGAFASLWLTGMPMGFLAILGITSLIGVIVSHVIVLFDFIEEQHEDGAPLREALIEAGIRRIRPVLITVGATVLALFPLALHGGPLWEALCYAQIGGLTLATAVTLFLVPVFYAVFVLDLRIVQWGTVSAID
jgi:multidrug efflux pump subunit AcrB